MDKKFWLVGVGLLTITAMVFFGLSCYFYRQTMLLRLEVDSLSSQVSSLTDQISNLQIIIEKKDNRIEIIELNYEQLESEYDTLISEYDFLEIEHEKLSERYEIMYDSRYDEGYIQGLSETGYTIIDPTYEDALQFIRSDRTDRNRWTEKYTCFNFAADFKNNAFEAGYRCGFVRIEFPESAHAIVCFNTIDEGLIFIEPQDDDLVTLTIGESYWDRSKYRVSYDDTIVSFTIIW